MKTFSVSPTAMGESRGEWISFFALMHIKEHKREGVDFSHRNAHTDARRCTIISQGVSRCSAASLFVCADLYGCLDRLNKKLRRDQEREGRDGWDGLLISMRKRLSLDSGWRIE